MSASRGSPTIGINLLVFPLSPVTSCFAALPAKKSAFNMRQNAYHRNLKCIFESFLPCYCYAKRPIVVQFAPAFRNLPLQAEKRI